MSRTERFARQIAGGLSCFDRVVITGTLVDIAHARSATRWLNARHIMIFDFPTYAKLWRETIRENAERLAAEAGVEIEFIRRSTLRKEERVKAILRERKEQCTPREPPMSNQGRHRSAGAIRLRFRRAWRWIRRSAHGMCFRRWSRWRWPRGRCRRW
jgi:hypothetical protein